MTLCSVCSNHEKKYKCPKCEIVYCSVNCFKIHDCQKPGGAFTIDTTSDAANVAVTEEDYLIEVPEEFLIPADKLEQLRHSEELKSLLQNPHLRDFLQFAHETYNTSGFMKLAMNEPLFIEFADACLRAIHPEDYQKELTDQEIVQHLKETIEKST